MRIDLRWAGGARFLAVGFYVGVFLGPGAATALAGSPILDPRHPVARALTFFRGSEADGGESLVRGLRPAPLSPTLRAEVVAALPTEGELQPTPAERAKIAALEPVLELHDRNGVVVVKVIEVGHAFVGLHARSVLLLSRDALSLVDAEELQALAAHELGHELFWDDYQEARSRGDHRTTQELELRCDGVAVATLHRLGRPSEVLVAAVVKMTRYNEALGATATGANYVSLKQRRQFIQKVTVLLGASAALSRRAP